MTNQHCIYLPAAEAIRRVDWLSENLVHGGEVFVRPDAADKRVSGRLIETDELRRQLQAYAFDPTFMILVARPLGTSRRSLTLLSTKR